MDGGGNKEVEQCKGSKRVTKAQDEQRIWLPLSLPNLISCFLFPKVLSNVKKSLRLAKYFGSAAGSI